MFQRLRIFKTGNRHQDEFLARYDHVLKWAKQLSANRSWQAEDLAQDAYLQFMAIRPDLDEIHNLDAYLYAIVRNLHRSMLHRHLRLRQVPLSILDFDRAEDGLKLIEKEHEHDVLEDLESIRVFACERRETSKIGSLLILRFFYGYSVEETAKLMGVNRAALDSRLLRARKEAREYLADQRSRASGKVLRFAALDAGSMRKEPLCSDHCQIDSITILRDRIFDCEKGECIPASQMKALYAAVAPNGIENKLLAHIVCCRMCLDFAVRCSGIANFNHNPPDNPASGRPDAGKGTSRLDKLRRVREWDRQLKRVLEHRPQELRVTVNGVPLVSQPVVSGRGELTISVPLTERIEFIEVLSEQEVRLLMLPVLAVPPEGEYEQGGELDFGDGRVLSIRLTFDDPWPTVHVQYGGRQDAPVTENAIEPPVFGSYAAPYRNVTKPEDFRRLLWRFWNPVSWLNPRFFSGAVAVLLIVVLLFVQTHQNTASAAALVDRMEAWQRNAAQPGAVLHRTFDFIQHDKHSLRVARRRVEVWRKPNAGMKISKLLDSSGTVIVSARIGDPLPALTASDAWQFEPAADTYRALAGDLGKVRVKTGGGEVELIASFVRLKLNGSTYAPTEEIIDTPDATFEFREQSTESEPERFSPFAPEPPPARAKLRTPKSPAAERQPAVSEVSEAELDAAEIAVRAALHRVNADLGEQIRIYRRERDVEVAGILDSNQRKNEIEDALAGLSHVRTSLLSPDSVESPDVNARTVAALQTTPSSVSRISPAVLAHWLEQQYPNPGERLAYVNHIGELARECLGHAHALKELADRYGALNAPLVRPIAQDHLAELQKRWTELIELTASAAGTEVSGQTGNAAPNTSSDAAPSNAASNSAAKLLKSLNEFNRCLLRLFAEHSALQEPDSPERELQTYWTLRHDAATSLAALSTK